MMTTAGLTGCHAGWLLISLDDTPPFRILQDEELSDTLKEFGRVFTDVSVGLPDDELERACDRLLRERFGEQSDIELMPPPMRVSLDAPSYVEANLIHLDHVGEELPLRTWSQFPRVRLLDRIVRDDKTLKEELYQSYSELLFMQLNGRRIYQNRATKKGLKHRLDLLEEEFPVIGKLFRELKENYRRNEIEELKILDAAALAFGANRSFESPLQSLPADPPRDRFGLRMGFYYI